ncbi:hypothetical protein IIC45_00290, partial [Patescibacteria group bacterium]|nr:hypothetical protein [Patescibacteria group bacterium]
MFEPVSLRCRKEAVQAIETLRDSEREPTLTPAHGALINIAMMRGENKAQYDAMAEGLRANPESYVIRRRYLFALQPKWGGSVQQMRAFLDRTAEDRHGDKALARLQARKTDLVRHRIKYDAAQECLQEIAHEFRNGVADP